MGQIDELFEQIDEELETDQLHKFWQKWHNWIIGGFLLFFGLLFAFVGWQHYREQQDQQASDRYAEAMKAANRAKPDEATINLATLFQEHGGHGYAILARLLEARILVEAGKMDEAVQKMERLVEEGRSIPPLADLALLQSAYITSKDVTRCRTFLARVPAESPYRPLALELEGVLAGQQGDTGAALAKFQEAMAKKPAGNLRERLQQRIDRLGGSGT